MATAAYVRIRATENCEAHGGPVSLTQIGRTSAGALKARKVKTMNGLRVYIKPVSTSLIPADNVFYSRRGDGPYYRWLEEKGGRWRGARVIAADFKPHSLSMASWKTVPVTLQTRLGEHYLD